MIHVVFDTSSLPQHVGHLSQEFSQLKRLVDDGVILVHIPEIAWREWLSQRTHDLKKVFQELGKALVGFEKHGWSKHIPSLKDGLTPFKPILVDKDVVSEASRIGGKEFEKWLKVTIIKSQHDDGREVFDRYFEGKPPFKSPKNRNDLPDAFIYCAIANHAATCNSDMVCIVADNTLKDTLAQLGPRVLVFESVGAALKAEPLESHLESAELVRLWYELRCDVIESLKRDADRISMEIESAVQAAVTGESVCSFDIPSDDNQAMITSVYDCSEILIDFDNAVDRASAWISVPFSCKLPVEVEFMVYRGDAFSVDDWVQVSIGDFEEDYCFDASGERCLTIAGHVSIHFDEETLRRPDNWEPDSIEVDETFSEFTVDPIQQ